MKKRIFVSSVQREFASMRKQVAAMIRKDRWLNSFFEVFLFEEGNARAKSAQDVYLEAVADADIYLALIGDTYGNADEAGVSPTEHEFDKASELNKERLVFVRKSAAKREPKEATFLEKVGNAVTWKAFTTSKSLKDAVYDALFIWLHDKDLVTTKPFDRSCSRGATLADVDPEKFSHYVALVNRRRKVTLEPDISISALLEKIGAKEKNSDRLTNAVFPLFAKRPDEEKISWEIRCSHYYGFDAVKPIPVLKTYNGTVFDLAEPTFEPRVGFFHTILWRKGYGPQGLFKGPSHKTQSTGQSHRPESGRIKSDKIKSDRIKSDRIKSSGTFYSSQTVNDRILCAISSSGSSSSEIAKAIGVTKHSAWFRTRMLSMIDDAIIERTIPEKPNSRLQKYRLTDKGLKLLSSIARSIRLLSGRIENRGSKKTGGYHCIPRGGTR